MLEEKMGGSKETVPDAEKLLDEDLDKVSAGNELAGSISDLKATAQAFAEKEWQHS